MQVLPYGAEPLPRLEPPPAEPQPPAAPLRRARRAAGGAAASAAVAAALPPGLALRTWGGLDRGALLQVATFTLYNLPANRCLQPARSMHPAYLTCCAGGDAAAACWKGPSC